MPDGALDQQAIREAAELAAKTRDSIAQLSADVKELTAQYVAAMEAIKLREGIRIAMAVSGRANKFLQVSSFGWRDTRGPYQGCSVWTFFAFNLGLSVAEGWISWRLAGDEQKQYV